MKEEELEKKEINDRGERKGRKVEMRKIPGFCETAGSVLKWKSMFST